jgi:predicted Zn-dependent peptidase
MNIRRANQKGNGKIYTCSRYNKYGVAHCSQHKIEYDRLYGIMLEKIRKYAKLALENEGGLAEKLMLDGEKYEQSELAVIEKSISDDKARLAVMEKLIAKLYEDTVAGVISAENFNTVLRKAQAEQKTLQSRLKSNTERISEGERERDDNSRWLNLIREYAGIEALDAETLNQLIKKIVLFEDTDGETIRRTVEIHFNFCNITDKHRLIME